jgi:serine/threonine protein kinase
MTKPAGWSAAAAAPERALAPGTRIDDYEIEQALDQGGVAIVYRAFDHALGLQVALEEYMPDAMVVRIVDGRVALRARAQGHTFEEGRQAFIAEAQTLARCEHPALLRIDRILQRHGTVYRAMRLYAGPKLLEHRRTLAEAPDGATLLRWVEDLLGALSALHAEGCVHGALDPGRIVLRDSGHLLLLDFDAVRRTLISGRTQEMLAAMEPCFAAPEQRGPSAGASVGPWTDLYALAATLRFCIDGALPPPASALATDQPARLVSDAWRSVKREAADASGAAWMRAIDACLADAPQDRPQSVAQLRHMIDEAVVLASTLPTWPAPRIAAGSPQEVGATPEGDDSVEAPDVVAETQPQQSPPQSPEPDPELEPAPETELRTVRVPKSEAVPQPEPTVKPAPQPTHAPAPAPATEGAAADTREPGATMDAPAASASTEDEAPADAVVAKVMADLEETLARIAATTTSTTVDAGRSAPAWDSAPGPARKSEPEPEPEPAPSFASAPAFVLANPRKSWRHELLALWRLSPTVWAMVTVAVIAMVGLLVTQLPRSPARLDLGDAASAAPATVVQAPAFATADAQAEGLGRRSPVPAEAVVESAPPDSPPVEAAPPAVNVAAPRPPPRTQCRGQSGYALYQCMQTQCAKRSYTKHPQCVRLRRTQSLN